MRVRTVDGRTLGIIGLRKVGGLAPERCRLGDRTERDSALGCFSEQRDGTGGIAGRDPVDRDLTGTAGG